MDIRETGYYWVKLKFGKKRQTIAEYYDWLNKWSIVNELIPEDEFLESYEVISDKLEPPNEQ